MRLTTSNRTPPRPSLTKEGRQKNKRFHPPALSLTKEGRQIIKYDKKYIWHPFTQMADWVKNDPSEIVSIAKAKGNYLYDSKGTKYLDCVSSLWTTVHGHNHKTINQAITKQLSKVAHTTFLGLTHEPAVRLAKSLVEIAPSGLSRVFYSDNGSTSVEIAVKMAFQYWKHSSPGSKKNTFLSLREAYHGDTIGSVSVGGMSLFHGIFKPLLFKCNYAPTPHCFRCKHRKNDCIGPEAVKSFKVHTAKMGCKGQCVFEFENILKKTHKTTAAVIVEPMVQGAAGMYVMPAGYLSEINRIRKKYNTLLICDEVATGFGRTGKMFACEHENIQPDFMCLSKGISAGYLPLAATLTTEKVYKAFLGKYEEFKTFFHGHTYTANPLACAAAIASLEVFKKENTISNLRFKISHLNSELKKFKTIKYVGDVRQIGLMATVELVQSVSPIKDFPAKMKLGAQVCAECRKHSMMLRPLGNCIVFMPPLSVTNTEITRMLNTVKKALLKIAVK